MNNKIIKLLVSIILIFLISACATSDISYKNEQLNLQLNDSLLQVHGTQLKQHTENFRTLFLIQKMLRLDDGSIIVFEEARTDLEYQFDTTTARSIDVIFDAKRVVKLYYNGLIYAFQVVLQDNRVLNVLATQGYDQKLQLIYGMSTDRLNSILKHLDSNAPSVYYRNVINLSHEPTPFMSRWTTWKVHFFPLVVPLRLMGKM